jgi:hypothetical protein
MFDRSSPTTLALTLIALAALGCGSTGPAHPAGTGGSGGDGTGGTLGLGGTSGTGGGGTGGGGTGGGGTGGGDLPDAAPDVAPDTAPDLAPDLAPDVAPDQAPDVSSCPEGTACMLGGAHGLCKTGVCATCAEPTDDGQCKSAYGAGYGCFAGDCSIGTCHGSQACGNGQLCSSPARTCQACQNDGQCKSDGAYGSQTICLNGACVTGDCHDKNSDCRKGEICGLALPHKCSACTADTQCDQQFSHGTLCVAGACVTGDCRASSDCSAAKDGLICGVKTANTCGKCTSDDQCQADTRYKNSRNLCKTAAGTDNGECLTNGCNNNGQTCAANGADFCCGNKCVPGNCCQDSDCTSRGANFTCSKNSCTQCELAAGNQYLVDPVNGSDAIGTGSGKAGGAGMPKCAFRTITRALRFIGDNPPVGTTITIVGAAGATTDLYTVAPAGSNEAPEANVIELQENTKVTTSGGPVRMKLQTGAIGFRFIGAGSALVSGAGARLTIDGGNDQSASGVVVALDAGKVTVQDVTIKNTGDDGVRVLKGTVDLGPGVQITDAGKATPADAQQSGVLVVAGTANLRGTASAPTIIANNSQYGVSVSGTGEVNVVNGAPVITPAPTGDGTVVVKNNAQGGVVIAQAAGATHVNNLDGLVSWGNTAGPGLGIVAGSKVQLRNSVLLANGGSGVLITPADATAAGNDTSGIDLGQAFAGAGKNTLQMKNVAGAHPNAEAGICALLAPRMGDHTSTAQGNVFAGPRDCTAANPGAVIKGTACAAKVDLALPVIDHTTITVNVAACTQ